MQAARCRRLRMIQAGRCQMIPGREHRLIRYMIRGLRERGDRARRGNGRGSIVSAPGMLCRPENGKSSGSCWRKRQTRRSRRSFLSPRAPSNTTSITSCKRQNAATGAFCCLSFLSAATMSMSMPPPEKQRKNSEKTVIPNGRSLARGSDRGAARSLFLHVCGHSPLVARKKKFRTNPT